MSFNAENLDEVALELDLQAQISEPFPKTGGSGIAGFPKVIKAATVRVLEDDMPAKTLGDDRYVVIKLEEGFQPDN